MSSLKAHARLLLLPWTAASSRDNGLSSLIIHVDSLPHFQLTEVRHGSLSF